jgi:hypothetical protein
LTGVIRGSIPIFYTSIITDLFNSLLLRFSNQG